MQRDWSKFYTPGAVLIAGLLIAGAMYAALAPKSAAQPGGQVAVDVKDVSIDGTPFIGKADAPVVMAIWTDYQCPFCKAVETGGISQIPVQPAIPELVSKFVDTGKLKIVFKDFVFLGNDSMDAAEYGRAIWHLYPKQYFDWRTAMYEAQDEEGDKGFGNTASIDTLVKKKFPGMSTADIKADIAANKKAYDTAIDADRTEASKFGINGTPGTIIGTTLISGAQSPDVFVKAVEAEL